MQLLCSDLLESSRRRQNFKIPRSESAHSYLLTSFMLNLCILLNLKNLIFSKKAKEWNLRYAMSLMSGLLPQFFQILKYTLYILLNLPCQI